MKQVYAPLNSSQNQLVTQWLEDLDTIVQSVVATYNELMLYRLEKMARELKLDTHAEKWVFDFKRRGFERVDGVPKVTPQIPSKKHKKKVLEETQEVQQPD